jgi:hypothetical protein
MVSVRTPSGRLAPYFLLHASHCTSSRHVSFSTGQDSDRQRLNTETDVPGKKSACCSLMRYYFRNTHFCQTLPGRRQSLLLHAFSPANFVVLISSPMPVPARSAAVRLLGLWVRIPLGAWMSVCCGCCVLSGRGLCDGLITRPEESYRVWCV